MTLPPAASIAAMASREERPVVTTSSTSSTALAGLHAKAAAKLERPLRPFDEHRRLAERAAHFMADDHAAHRRGDHRVHILAHLLWELFGQRSRQPLGAGRVHQHARALEIARASQARGQDEVPFEQCVRRAEFREDLIVAQHR